MPCSVMSRLSARVPKDHPLRAIRALVDGVLGDMSVRVVPPAFDDRRGAREVSPRAEASVSVARVEDDDVSETRKMTKRPSPVAR
jgi:hypothetical protein